MNKKLKTKLNKIFKFKQKSEVPEKENYGVTTLNEDLTLGIVDLQGNSLKPWNNPRTNINRINANFTEGQHVQVDIKLLKRAIELLEASGETNTISLLVKQDKPVMIKNELFAVLIALYDVENKKTAQDEWSEVQKVLEPIKVMEAL